MRSLFSTFLLLTLSTVSVFGFVDEKTRPTSVRITPPAPKFTDAERQADLARRRASVAAKMADNSMLILFSAESKLYTNDVDYVFRQENNLFYLTNLKQEGATFVMLKQGGKTTEFIFLPKRDPRFETWNGKMYSNEQAATISGIKTIVNSAERADFLEAVKAKKAFASKEGTVEITTIPETIYLFLPNSDHDRGGRREYVQEFEFSKQLVPEIKEDSKVVEKDDSVRKTPKKAGKKDKQPKEVVKAMKKEDKPNFKLLNARPVFNELRQIKSSYELAMLQHAIDITTEAQMQAWTAVIDASMEYEVQAVVEYTFRRRNADYWGYPSIVGCGPNATTLHYEEAQGPVKKGDLLLMDVGAEYEHYTADVTRTFPVNGKFSKEQAEIYRIVYDAQEAAAKAIKPGVTMRVVSDAADQVIKDGLLRLGLITDVNSQQHRIWYMHGLGHYLGMNVHDVSALGLLAPGMTFTNEPGIYIREDALENLPDTPENKAFIEKVRPAFEKYKNIGVRIEDDMLVTANGVEWMTKNLPRKLEDIEAFMANSGRTAVVPFIGTDPASQRSGR